MAQKGVEMPKRGHAEEQVIAVAAAFVALWRKKVNPAWVVLGGAAAGGLAAFLWRQCP